MCEQDQIPGQEPQDQPVGAAAENQAPCEVVETLLEPPARNYLDEIFEGLGVS